MSKIVGPRTPSCGTTPNTSTNVRIKVPRWARIALRAVGWAAPGFVAAQITRRLLATRRRPRSDAELALRSTARRIDLELGGARFVAWELGAGPAVFLMHGWDGSAGDFAHLAPALAAAGYRAVAIDALGHGDADGSDANVAAMAGALGAAVAALGPAHAVVAHSFGAPAAALARDRGLAYERLVLLAPEPDLGGYVRELGGLGGAGVLARVRQELVRRVGLLPEEIGLSRSMGALRPMVVHDLGDRVVPFELVASAFPQVLRTSGLGHRRVLSEPTVVGAVVDYLRNKNERSCPHRYVDGTCPQCALSLELFRPSGRQSSVAGGG
ncbi:MAG: alpha/beta hydrolase [Myxococcota bacterium]